MFFYSLAHIISLMKTLENILDELGLSVARASKLSGIPYWTIYQHKRGWRAISAESALKYEQTLGISKSDLRPDLWPAKRKRRAS